MQEAVRQRSLEIKGSMQTILTLHLLNNDHEHIQSQLAEHFEHAPALFKQQALLIDINNMQGQINADILLGIKKLCQEYHLHILGVSGAHSIVDIEALKVSQLPQYKPQKKQVASKSQPAAEPTPLRKSKEVIKMGNVRSGQQLDSPADLIIIGNVAPGSEITAVGHIHVYGGLMGRAIAGSNGNKEARIFASALDPELLCIAGIYATNDDLSGPITRACMAFLEEESICLQEI